MLSIFTTQMGAFLCIAVYLTLCVAIRTIAVVSPPSCVVFSPSTLLFR
jgi:hypothetical protein